MPRPDFNRDEMRRQLREHSATVARETAAMGPVYESFLASDASVDQRMDALFGRRRFFAIGGLSVAVAGLLAACASSDPGGIARVGIAPTTTALPDPVVNDVVLLRTASSLEHSAISVYDLVIGNEDLLDQKAFGDIAKRFRDDHAGHAALFEKLTKAIGGEAWTCGNTRLDQVVIAPIIRAIGGGPKTDLLAETPASDDPKRDVLNFAHALETLAGETYQSLMPALSDPLLRKQAITIGTHEVRHAALLAIAITGRPTGYATPDDLENATLEVTTTTAAPTTTQNLATPTTVSAAAANPPTKIPVVYALPGAYGKLNAVQLVVGKPNESGTRLTTNIETPSLNSFVYEYMSPSCPAT